MRSATARVVVLGVLCTAFVIPLYLISGIVAERRGREREARAEIARSWAGPQTVVGPALSLELECGTIEQGGMVERRRRLVTLLPSELEIAGDLATERRSRGIFEALVYRAELTLRGRFDTAVPREYVADCATTRVLGAALVVALSDPRGIEDLSALSFAGEAITWQPGTGRAGPWERGAHARLPVDTGVLQPELPFDLRLSLRGSERIELLPIGRRTRVTLAADWGSPGFRGSYLPERHEIASEKFAASWRISELARSFPAHWCGVAPPDEIAKSAFGVELVLPADGYQRVERSLKYGLLFVVLTFATVFLFEIVAGTDLHPIHYGLVGAALCVFYLLLLSISEQLGFRPAFSVAAGATVLLIASYSLAVLGSVARALILGGVLVGLYSALYTLLAAEELALLIGSLVLFAVLACLMWWTRRIDWRRPVATAEVAS